MPVLSSRRYGSSTAGSSSYLSSSSLGNYRSSYSTSSSSATASTSRYNYGNDSSTSSSYRSYRPSLTGSTTLGRDTLSSYRSNYTNDDSSKSSLSTRIGVSSEKDSTSNYRSRYNRISVDKDTKSSLSSLPPITSSSLPPPSPFLNKKRPSITREQQQQSNTNSNAGALSKSGSNSIDLANDLDSMYEKYSPSRYRTKYEFSRTSRALSDAAPANNKSNDDYDSSTIKSSTYTPKSEVGKLF